MYDRTPATTDGTTAVVGLKQPRKTNFRVQMQKPVPANVLLSLVEQAPSDN